MLLRSVHRVQVLNNEGSQRAAVGIRAASRTVVDTAAFPAGRRCTYCKNAPFIYAIVYNRSFFESSYALLIARARKKREEKTIKSLLTIIGSLEHALSESFDILHRNFHDLFLHFIVQIDAVFGTSDVVSEIISTEIFLQVVQPIEKIGRLPYKFLYVQSRLYPLSVIIL